VSEPSADALAMARELYARFEHADNGNDVAALGKAIPLNPEPIIGGNIELTDGVARVVKPHPAVKLYTSHFANCPSANAHRKERRR
jgi:hypothetical protein